MAAGDLITMDYQYEFNGLLFGWTTELDVEELSGFMGYPSVRSSSDDSFGRHGGVPGRHYLPARMFTMEFNVHGSENDVEYKQLLQDVDTALGPITLPTGELPFVYKHPGADLRYINCRPTDYTAPVNRMYALKYPHGAVRFEASDPRHYSLAVNSSIATLPTPGGGLDFPLNFSATGGLNFGVGEAGSTSAVNAGNAPAHWRAVITGPVIDPALDISFSSTPTINTLEVSGLTVQAGEELVFDTRYRTVKIGEESRRSFLTPQSDWVTLPPGETVTFSFRSADAAPTGATATIYWSDAYWSE